MSLKNRSRCKLNRPNRKTFSDFSSNWLRNGAYCKLQLEFQISLFRFMISWKFRSRCKLNETNRRRSPNPLLVPKHHLGYSTCYRMNQTFLCWYSESPWKTGPSASWTVPIGGGQISHEQIYANILPFMASLGKLPIWDHQIGNALNESIHGNFFHPFWVKPHMCPKYPLQ